MASLDDLLARVSEFRSACGKRRDAALRLVSEAEAFMASEEEGTLRRQHLDRAASRMDAAEYWLTKAFSAFQEAEGELRHVTEGPDAS